MYLERFHWPAARELWAAGMWRARLRMWPTVSSAAEMMFEVGAFTTITPAVVAALMSTLSRPTPARAMTFSFGADAIASASTFVADRTSTAAASASAASSAGRSVPSTDLISKSGPRASTVAGESSSAIRTTGFVTWQFLRLEQAWDAGATVIGARSPHTLPAVACPVSLRYADVPGAASRRQSARAAATAATAMSASVTS